eukprot:Rhum_TRINITY_DN25995_c0_g1::Rhum_TRINITY_DN25995_c0_g1_i1::g.183002::m.183002
MGCCQSGLPAQENEIPPKSRRKRDVDSQALPADATQSPTAGETANADTLPGDVNTGPADVGQVAEGEDRFGTDDALDQVLSKGWKFFIQEAPNNYVAEDEAEDEEADWSFGFGPKLVPPGGFPAPSKALFTATVETLPPANGLALLQACRPSPCSYHNMIDLTSQLVSPIVGYKLPAAGQADHPRLVVDVQVSELIGSEQEEA